MLGIVDGYIYNLLQFYDIFFWKMLIRLLL
jgi:hypothetical protein